MELMTAYHYRDPGEFQASINLQKAKNGDFIGFWTTEKGLVIRPANMTDSHLLNCIRLTERRVQDIDLRELASQIMSKKYRRNKAKNIRMDVIAEYLRKSKTYLLMIEEAKNRGLI
ncbi:diguanylate cyclase [Paenibacillus sp. TCA20]|uniref:Uncharacterized protein n=1 Tax=Paenibacillus urinalis TaxID=521520 RepID=A0ABY7XK98_9BACL|nr:MULTISPECIES: hypothetical protein [Paenibacillus]WDI05201.1 hypothetical protein PUW25_25675 [Paenibacillus urinalis]GAK41970.1 diguanylate cyclase [Paenibacillus sp. TCA20]